MEKGRSTFRQMQWYEKNYGGLRETQEWQKETFCWANRPWQHRHGDWMTLGWRGCPVHAGYWIASLASTHWMLPVSLIVMMTPNISRHKHMPLGSRITPWRMWTLGKTCLYVCVKEKKGEKGEFARKLKKGEGRSSGLRWWNKPTNEFPPILYHYLATLKFISFKRVSSKFQAVHAIHIRTLIINLVSILDV